MISLFQSCGKPDPLSSIGDETLYFAECPWHGAQFDQDGNVVRNPDTGESTTPLTKYPASLSDNAIIITGSDETVLLSDHPALQEVGGVSSLSTIDIDGSGVLLYRKSETEILVFSRTCTHQGDILREFQEV